MLKIYNTEKREKEALTLRNKGTRKLLIYTCGPTVYDYAHIGNFRTYVFEDVLRRTIKYFGFPIRQVMNLTDVDDKTIKGAMQLGIPLSAYTQIYKKAFFADLKMLNIEPVEEYVSATDAIPETIQMIAVLLKKNLAYQGDDGSIYFNINTFPSYGRLSHAKVSKSKKDLPPETLEDEYTPDLVSDFALWKAYDPKRDGDVYWEAPFGRGRPGWHIECSAMAINWLAETLDIHVGGVDNIFPHHENEIAQSEGYTGKKFVRYWMHVAHLIVEGKKMSKSFGNFYTLRDLIKKGYSGVELRYLLLKTHYRTQLNFTMDELEASRQALLRWRGCIERLRMVEGVGGKHSLSEHIHQARTTFKKALADDLNTSMGLAALFDLIKIVNTEIDSHHLSQDGAQEVLRLFEEVDMVLGILPIREEAPPIPRDVQEALAKRESARAEKNWKEADKQREYIQMRGYTVEDSAVTSTVKKRP